MSKSVPTSDRIINKYLVVDPSDKTALNADNVLLMIDKTLNGQYRSKVYQATYAEIEALTDKEAGEIFFATDLQQFVGYNGTSLIIIG